MNVAKPLTAEQSALIAEMIGIAKDRIATCEIYTNRRALVSHNWAVVSSLWNCRGVFIIEEAGQRNIAVGPFPKCMPTLWTKRDAEAYAAELNAKGSDNGETFSVVCGADWWAKELEEARAVLASAESMAVQA